MFNFSHKRGHTMFYDQLKKLCDEKGVSPTTVVELLGMSKGTMSNWKKGGTPNGDAVVRFSEYFNVSTDFLLKGEDNPSLALTESEKEIYDMIHQLSEKKKWMIAGIVSHYLASEKHGPVITEDDLPAPIFRKGKNISDVFKDSTKGQG